LKGKIFKIMLVLTFAFSFGFTTMVIDAETISKICSYTATDEWKYCTHSERLTSEYSDFNAVWKNYIKGETNNLYLSFGEGTGTVYKGEPTWGYGWYQNSDSDKVAELDWLGSSIAEDQFKWLKVDLGSPQGNGVVDLREDISTTCYNVGCKTWRYAQQYDLE
jgi:hypothetical protein